MSHYATLGVRREATADEIRAAWRSLAQLHHPDKGGDGEKFKSLSEAWKVLGDPVARAAYDRRRVFPGLPPIDEPPPPGPKPSRSERKEELRQQIRAAAHDVRDLLRDVDGILEWFTDPERPTPPPPRRGRGRRR